MENACLCVLSIGVLGTVGEHGFGCDNKNDGKFDGRKNDEIYDVESTTSTSRKLCISIIRRL